MVGFPSGSIFFFCNKRCSAMTHHFYVFELGVSEYLKILRYILLLRCFVVYYTSDAAVFRTVTCLF